MTTHTRSIRDTLLILAFAGLLAALACYFERPCCFNCLIGGGE